MKQRREPLTDEQLNTVLDWLLDHMREHLERAGMDASPEAVHEACRRRLRARFAMQALASGAPAAVDPSPAVVEAEPDAA